MKLVIGAWYVVQRIHPGNYYEHLYGKRVQYRGKPVYTNDIAEVQMQGNLQPFNVWAMDLAPYKPVNNEDGAFYLKKEEYT